MSFESILCNNKLDPETTTEIKPIKFDTHPDTIKNILEKMQPNEHFYSEDGGLRDGETFWVYIYRTATGLYTYHRQCIKFWTMLNGVVTNPVVIESPTKADWEVMFVNLGYGHFSINHYDYCDLMLNNFFLEVFGKSADDMWCGGMVGAHGDKAYQYKKQWADANIPFNHGVLLFLLTYTSQMDREKWESVQFVIDKYQHYLPMLKRAEEKTFHLKPES